MPRKRIRAGDQQRRRQYGAAMRHAAVRRAAASAVGEGNRSDRPPEFSSISGLDGVSLEVYCCVVPPPIRRVHVELYVVSVQRLGD